MSDGGLRTRWASAPGETVRAVLGDRGSSIENFARTSGLSLTEASDLLDGRLAINAEMAKSLATTVGASVEFWLTREAQYREDLERVEADRWSETLPLKQMTEFGWIRQPVSWQDRIDACLEYFDVASIAAWDARYAAQVEGALFRSSPAFEQQTNPTAVWFRACELQASQIPITAPFSHALLADALIQIRGLTRHSDPQQFVPQLIDACASVGVYLAVVRAPDGCTASGATRLFNGRPLIALSARYLSDDHFWFTFYHEAAHVLEHYASLPIIDSDDDPASDLEDQANSMAGALLLGKNQALARPASFKEIIRVAQSAGVSPGIIVGQLQHHGIIRRNQYNSLKRRYVWNRVTLEKANRR